MFIFSLSYDFLPPIFHWPGKLIVIMSEIARNINVNRKDFLGLYSVCSPNSTVCGVLLSSLQCGLVGLLLNGNHKQVLLHKQAYFQC